MGRASVKENKNAYHLAREELELSREKASELLGSVPADRIEKIENEKVIAHPEEVLVMAEKYKNPSLLNYYCSSDCPIGQKCVAKVEIKDLSAIVLGMLASLNSVNKEKERLIEITADGKIDENEIEDFIHIQKELDRISFTVDTLKLWTEMMLANGSIDNDIYEAKKNQ